jgi:hypothetical protein
MKNTNHWDKTRKALDILLLMFAACLLIWGSYLLWENGVHAIFSTHIENIKLVQDYGPAEEHFYADPGYRFLMIRIVSSDYIIDDCLLPSIELIDNMGNHYERSNFSDMCVFEVPITNQGFTLVVNRWIKIPVQVK